MIFDRVPVDPVDPPVDPSSAMNVPAIFAVIRDGLLLARSSDVEELVEREGPG